MSVGSYHRPSGVSSLSAKDERVARGEGSIHESFDAREVFGVDQGRDGRRRVATVAQDVRLGLAREAREELVANTLFDQEPRAREADLPGVVVHEGGFFRREVQVGVGVDHERSLSAEFAGEGNEVLRGRDGADVAARLGRAGKGDPTHPRVDTRAAPTSSPKPWTRLNTPGGKPASTRDP